ncbi:MAG TPA: Rpn family recombination-promoting nuclease/putative transposase [Chthoniobacterales bacterium]|nr:Rpn family recombination-promoting nuclease/putative transposase [Chthoniobacterales bacterium]
MKNIKKGKSTTAEAPIMDSSKKPKKKASTPHDFCFRKIMSNPKMALDLMTRCISADIIERIDFKSLKLVDESFIDGFFHEYRTDILYSANLIFKKGGKIIATPVYFLLEHQRKMEQIMPVRIQRYGLCIIERHWESHKKDKYPTVFTLIFYNGKRRYSSEPNLINNFELTQLLKSPFITSYLMDLNTIKDEEIKSDAVGLVELVFKYIDIPKSSDLIQKIGHLIPIVEKKNIDIIETVIQYIYETRKDGISTEEIGKEFQQYLSTTNKELVMTIAQRLREEGMQTGMQQGIQQGMEKGIQKGEAILLSRLLKSRFPRAVTKKYIDLINKADSETLTLWADKFVDAKNIQDVFSGTKPLHN